MKAPAGRLAQFGPDAVRVTMVVAGPPDEDMDWADVAPTGSVKWLARVAARRRPRPGKPRRRPGDRRQVIKALGGSDVRKVIVRPPRLVNVVPAR